MKIIVIGSPDLNFR